MHRLFVPTFGPSDWRRLLADPERQWRATRSAYELAVSWEAARQTERGLPPTIATLLDSVPELSGARLLLGVPEHQVQLEGGGHASQTDLWALLQTPVGVVSAAIEAKAGEPFDKSVTEWLEGASEKSGKPVRLQQLCQILRLEKEQAHRCRYQLLHRPVAAILEAKRFGLKHAMFLVQSLAADAQSASDFRCFGDQLGVVVAENQIVSAGERSDVQLWVGWVQAKPCDEHIVRAAV